MIEFSCASCGQVFRVKDEWAGKRARCKKCGQTVSVPQQNDGYNDTGTELSSAFGGYEQSHEVESSSLTESERRFLRLGIIAAVAIVPIMLAFLFLPGKFRQWSNDRAFALVEQKIRDGIESSKSHARSFEFDAANTDLVNLKDVVSEAEVSEDQTDDLNGRIAAIQDEVRREKAECERKLGQGYALKNGQLISPEEQKAQADRERDEQTAKTAALRRQYNQKEEAEEKAAAEQEAAAHEQRQQELAEVAAEGHESFLVSYLQTKNNEDRLKSDTRSYDPKDWSSELANARAIDQRIAAYIEANKLSASDAKALYRGEVYVGMDAQAIQLIGKLVPTEGTFSKQDEYDFYRFDVRTGFTTYFEATNLVIFKGGKVVRKNF